ncbi:HET-domain-containing protein [Xylariaceae sp. AK1471]|nr:HET-domain-containing protein [Xylariaceae sp. AK1471]
MEQNTSEIYEGTLLDDENEFRLLELQAGRAGIPVAVRLLTCSIGALQYEAVSYVWGDTTQRKKIYVTVANKDNMVIEATVTANCHAALERLRKEDEARILWVDSLCINQAVVRERNHQLTLMPRIYQGAKRVVVYLGETADDSDAAMNWIHEIDQPSDYSESPFSSKDPGFPQVDRAMVEALFQRPWFCRVWVLQEITLAREAVVICGSWEVGWDSFRAFRYWNCSQRWVKTLPYSVDYAESRSSGLSNFIPYAVRLFKMLKALRPCKATDARDKLFAILPLLDWEQKQMLSQFQEWRQGPDHDCWEPGYYDEIVRQTFTVRADYGSSVQQVFTELAGFLLQDIGLDTLRLVVDSSLAPQLPSWVIDWTAMPTYLFQKSPRSQRFRSFAGFREKPVHMWDDVTLPADFKRTWSTSESWSPHGHPISQLRISAVEVGSIALLSDTCDIRKNIFPIGQWTALGDGPKWWHEKPEVPKTITDEAEIRRWKSNSPFTLSPFVRTLAADNVVYPDVVNKAVQKIERYNRDQIEHEREEEEENRSKSQEAQIERKEPQLLRDIFRASGPSYQRQSEWIFEACDGRRLFVTNNGYIGLAPDTATVGDLVFVLKGCSVPFILRALIPVVSDVIRDVLTTDTVYTKNQVRRQRKTVIVGEGWVYGMMQGQIWDKVADKACGMHLEEIIVQ